MAVEGSSTTSPPRDPPDGPNTTATGSLEPSMEPMSSTARGGNPSDVTVTANGGNPEDVSFGAKDGNTDGSSVNPDGSSVNSGEEVKKKETKRMKTLFGDIALLWAAFSCFNDSIQFHQPYEQARARGGYYFFLVLLLCEMFIVVPVMSILLHCVNYTVSGISRFPQLYGKIFGFVGCGVLLISLMQQSGAISDASSHIAWIVQTRNGTDEIVNCQPFTEEEMIVEDHPQFYRKSFCTSIVKYKHCVENKLGRIWTRLDKTQGSCTWSLPDTLLFIASQEYFRNHFIDEKSGETIFDTEYLITYGATWLFLVLFGAGLAFVGAQVYAIVISGIAVLFLIFLSILVIYLQSVGNMNAGHIRFVNLTQFHHLFKEGTVGILSWCILDSLILRFPVFTLLSFRSQKFNPFHLGLGIGLSDLFLKIIYFYFSCSVAGVFTQFSYPSAHVTLKDNPFTSVVMTEMFAMVSNVHWNRFYLIILFLADLPRVTVPFVLCQAVARDHFPKKNKWLVLGISAGIIVAFQCAMFFYFWKANRPSEIINCVCGFYGLLLMAFIILSTVIVYGPMEFMLDIQSMSEGWRMRWFWRRIMAPFSIFMANNALIPILCFMAVPRFLDTFRYFVESFNIADASKTSKTSAAAVFFDVAMLCVPGIVMIGWLFYELGVTVYKKRLSPRLFYALPEHPSYARAVTATFKLKKEEIKHKKKDENETGKEKSSKH